MNEFMDFFFTDKKKNSNQLTLNSVLLLNTAKKYFDYLEILNFNLIAWKIHSKIKINLIFEEK